MNYCWWRDKEGEAHVVLSSEDFAGRKVYISYCGEAAVPNKDKRFGKVERAIREGAKVCMKCWNKLPREVLREITYI